MTEPKVVRYKARNPASIREFPDGGYVRYSDYEALAARVEELEERIRGYGHVWWTKDQQVEIDELKAKNKRLREALERVRGFCDPEPWLNGPPITLRRLHDIACAALQEPTDD